MLTQPITQPNVRIYSKNSVWIWTFFFFPFFDFFFYINAEKLNCLSAATALSWLEYWRFPDAAAPL